MSDFRIFAAEEHGDTPYVFRLWPLREVSLGITAFFRRTILRTKVRCGLQVLYHLE